MQLFQNPQPLKVSELTNQINATLGAHFSGICVVGEVSGCKNHQSGHIYFTLKDEEASVRCVAFKSVAAKIPFALENGLALKIVGDVRVYAQRGDYQIICNRVEKLGIGDLAEQFERLKEKLRNKGYFDESRKKKLPAFPRRIALLTSLSGAVLHDMKIVAKKRWNLLEITAIDTAVQGAEAKKIIAANIKIADSLGFDVIVIARGGGSLEDLWAFNEEIVADAIFAAKTPIVSAVGHESDYSLSDFVSDLRAPTPSACMERILPDKVEWLLRLGEMFEALNQRAAENLARCEKNLAALAESLRFFRFDYEGAKAQLEALEAAFSATARRFFQSRLERLEALKTHLELSNFFTPRTEALARLEGALEGAAGQFLRTKAANLVDFEALDSRVLDFLRRKGSEAANLAQILEAKNPKNAVRAGFAQVTRQGKVVALDELKRGDCVNLCDGESVREAEIR